MWLHRARDEREREAGAHSLPAPALDTRRRWPLVFLSTLSAVDTYVLRNVCSAHANVHLVHLHEAPSPNRRPLWRRMRAHPWRSIKGRVRDVVQGPLFARMEARIEQTLFGPSGAPDPADLRLASVTDAYTWEVSSETFLERLRALSPDRLIVCGAPILPPAVCSVAPHGAFNVHWGIAPEYRGGNSTFFALLEGRSDKIGVTLHVLTPGVDAGDVVGQATVSVTPDDDETSLWVRSAPEAAHLVSTLAALPAEAPLYHRPQGERGRLYRYTDRTLGRELRSALRRHVLGVRPEPAAGTCVLPHPEYPGVFTPAA